MKTTTLLFTLCSLFIIIGCAQPDNSKSAPAANTIETSPGTENEVPAENEAGDNSDDNLPANPSSALTEIQEATCDSASRHNRCNQLEDLGIVTAELCCSELSKCCIP